MSSKEKDLDKEEPDLVFHMCSVELVIRSRIANASELFSRSTFSYFNEKASAIRSDLFDNLIEQSGRAIEWHLNESQSPDYPATPKCQKYKEQLAQSNDASLAVSAIEDELTVKDFINLMEAAEASVRGLGKTIRPWHLSKVLKTFESLTRRAD
ncbi:hypothetical protein [Serratia symbiotica]|uniref:Uncharacterized protein n=1 Tax=Serratia symbiotica TaxID=138074 RepID=A0A068ZAI0_9GAMM|nr:hypothetical protein [Serratia symbiotica]QLH62763.1 hypothetical protein SYMBAF_07135 [Serratia symbiotica]CDS58081.1 hypothetical protein SYMBAF_50158 [Serratia symbiotica]